MERGHSPSEGDGLTAPEDQVEIHPFKDPWQYADATGSGRWGAGLGRWPGKENSVAWWVKLLGLLVSLAIVTGFVLWVIANAPR